mgnify:CR=1 FL=1
MKKLIILFSFFYCLVGCKSGQEISDKQDTKINLTFNNYLERGYVNIQSKHYKDAIDNYSRAIKIKPDYSDAHYNRGLAYFNLEKYQDAIDNYSNVIKINPDNEVAYTNRGLAFLNLGNHQLAIDDFNVAIKINPDSVLAYYNRGVSKWYLKLNYCIDFKKSCDLGMCDNYNTYCK